MSKYVLFSPVSGAIYVNGVLAPGATIRRTAYWRITKQRFEDSAQADASGRFSLPAIVGKSSVSAWLPHEPNIDQDLEVTYQGKTVNVWAFTKRGYDENDELGRALTLRIDTAQDETKHRTTTTGWVLGRFTLE